MMKKLNNVLNWKGSINKTATQVKSDCSLRNTQRAKWIITNDVVDTTIGYAVKDEDIKGGTMSLTQEDLILNINDLNKLNC